MWTGNFDRVLFTDASKFHVSTLDKQIRVWKYPVESFPTVTLYSTTVLRGFCDGMGKSVDGGTDLDVIAKGQQDGDTAARS